MKSLSKLFMACGLIVGLAACNKEPLAPEQKLPVAGNETIKLAFNISVPTTRSTTEDPQTGQTPSDATPDNEVGTATENNINTIQLVLLDNATKEIVAISNPKVTPTPEGTNATKYTVPFDSPQLVEASKNGERLLDVVAYINRDYVAAEGLEAALAAKTFDMNQVYTLGTDPSIWDTTPGFFMSNAAPVSFTLPSQESLLANYKNKPLNIGTIQVERLAARFDIDNTTLTYAIADQPCQVTFTGVALSNIAKQAYYLRSVNADGVRTTKWGELFMPELASSYLTDVEAKTKNDAAVEDQALDPAVEAKLFTQVIPTPEQYTVLSSLSREDDAAWNGEGTYKFWTYATENILPAPSTVGGNNQFENLTTNVSFKGELSAIVSDNTPAYVTAAFDGRNPIYVFDDVIYGSQETLARAAKGLPVDPNKTAEDLLADPTIEHWPLNTSLEAAYDKALAAVTPETSFAEACKAEERFEVFEPNAQGKYEIYYLYGNRHNNNLDPKVSAPMEFAVVRNNVYKLKIKSVKSFGTPKFEKGEPEPWEKKDAKFEVSVVVVPWTVRVNNIEF